MWNTTIPVQVLVVSEFPRSLVLSMRRKRRTVAQWNNRGSCLVPPVSRNPIALIGPPSYFNPVYSEYGIELYYWILYCRVCIKYVLLERSGRPCIYNDSTFAYVAKSTVYSIYYLLMVRTMCYNRTRMHICMLPDTFKGKLQFSP